MYFERVNYVIYDNNKYDLDYMNLSFNINGKKINLDGIFNIIHGSQGKMETWLIF
ncbi:MAG: hypothetical protein CM15mP102_08390 [Flavobacteriales bacterium]|nr:MAG: hypothetical protein CM15mP102_08390 [Flavobacteriales bacterium]